MDASNTTSKLPPDEVESGATMLHVTLAILVGVSGDLREIDRGHALAEQALAGSILALVIVMGAQAIGRVIATPERFAAGLMTSVHVAGVAVTICLLLVLGIVVDNQWLHLVTATGARAASYIDGGFAAVAADLDDGSERGVVAGQLEESVAFVFIEKPFRCVRDFQGRGIHACFVRHEVFWVNRGVEAIWPRRPVDPAHRKQ